MLNKESQAETEVDSEQMPIAPTSSPNAAKPNVMGSFVKPLNWIDIPEKRFGDIYKVMARADVPMLHTVGNACIEVTEKNTHGQSVCYEATLWCFNRGTTMVGYCEAWSVNEAKGKAFKWWTDFVVGFLNCP